MKFTVEETNLMCCFDTSNRIKLIGEMKNIPLEKLDPEMKELFCKTIQKLESMSNSEFEAIYIAPDAMMDD